MEFVLVLVEASACSGADGSSVTGLIGFIKVALDIVLTQDWMAMLLFTTTLLVNLGVVNNFLLLALDLVENCFFLLEAVSGCKVNQQTLETITIATHLFLLFISIGVMVGKFWKHLSQMGQETKNIYHFEREGYTQ